MANKKPTLIYDKENKEKIRYGYNIDFRDGGAFVNKGASINIDNDSLSYNYPFGIDLYVDFMFFDEEDYNRIYDVAKKELEFGQFVDNDGNLSPETITITCTVSSGGNTLLLEQFFSDDGEQEADTYIIAPDEFPCN